MVHIALSVGEPVNTRATLESNAPDMLYPQMSKAIPATSITIAIVFLFIGSPLDLYDVIRRELAGLRAGLDLHGGMVNASPGCPLGMTRWTVSAVSVVLIAQMCRSWTSETPVSFDR